MRAAMVERGEIAGEPGVLGEGLYSPRNIDVVYAAVLRQAQEQLGRGRSVVLDGTWQNAGYRERARELASDNDSVLVEFACAAPLDATVERIRRRTATTSQVTPDIATALADRDGGVWPGAVRLDTSRPITDSLDRGAGHLLAASV